MNETLYGCTDVFRLTVHIPCLENMHIVGRRRFFGLISEISQDMCADIFKVRRCETVAFRADSHSVLFTAVDADADNVLICLVDRLKKRELPCIHIIGSQRNADIFSGCDHNSEHCKLVGCEALELVYEYALSLEILLKIGDFRRFGYIVEIVLETVFLHKPLIFCVDNCDIRSFVFQPVIEKL